MHVSLHDTPISTVYNNVVIHTYIILSIAQYYYTLINVKPFLVIHHYVKYLRLLYAGTIYERY